MHLRENDRVCEIVKRSRFHVCTLGTSLYSRVVHSIHTLESFQQANLHTALLAQSFNAHLLRNCNISEHLYALDNWTA